MKRFLVLAAAVVGLTLAGTASTAKADHFVGGGWGGGSGRGYGYSGWNAGCGPRYRYRYRPVVAPGIFIGSPRFSVGIGTGYAYPSYPVYGPGYATPGYYGW